MRAKTNGKQRWSSIWSAYRYRAKRLGLKWTLTRGQFEALLRQDCHYCGRSPLLARGGRAITKDGLLRYYNGIDRKRDDSDYTPRSVVPCCARCNVMKGSLSVQEFKVQCFRIGTRIRWEVL